MEKFIEYFKNYYNVSPTTGIIRLIFDLLIVIALLIIFFVLIRKRVNIKRFLLGVLVLVILSFLSILFDLKILNSVMKNLSHWSVGFIILLYFPEIKASLDGKSNKDNKDSAFDSIEQKEETINVICNTVEYFSKRKIGALITFERKDSLDSLIEKAIPINADITQEILTTIFTPGTACHDGGLIIRNNKIVCAASYYPLTDNYDVPKFLGTRHRAAIGISEKYDAITIVVSEETGNVSITVAGNISLELPIERVRTLLDGYLATK